MALLELIGPRRKAGFSSRPDDFIVNGEHHLIRSRALRFGNFGNLYGATMYRDESGQQNHCSSVQSPTWTRFNGRNAIALNGTNQYLAMNGTMKDYMVSAYNRGLWIATWINFATSTTIGIVLGTQGPSQANRLTLEVNANYLGSATSGGVALFIYDSGGSNSLIFGSNTSPAWKSGWNHLAVSVPAKITYSGSQFYVNGAAIASQTDNSNTFSTAANFAFAPYIGTRDNVGSVGVFYAMSLSDFMMGVGPMSAGEIAKLADPENLMLDTCGQTLLLPSRRRVISSAANHRRRRFLLGV